jgi:plasmid stabilization system protein ParE
LSLKVRVTPEAQADLDEAQDWYEAASQGLGFRFLEAIESSLRLAADWPEAAPLVSTDARRALVQGFPYGLYYVAEGSYLVLLGCVHVRRHPRVWRSRLRRSPEA